MPLCSRHRLALWPDWRRWRHCLSGANRSSTLAAVSVMACGNCTASTRRRASRVWSGAGRSLSPRPGAAASRGCGAPISGRPTGRPTAWSICSNVPRRWPAPPTRPPGISMPGPGWPAWSSRRPPSNRSTSFAVLTAGRSGCTRRPSGDDSRARPILAAMRYDAIVIGGGHNGLTCAAYLAQAGRRRCSCSSAATCSAAPRSPRRSSPASSSRSARTSCRCCGPRSSASSTCRATASSCCRSTARFTPMPNGDYLWRVNDHAQDAPRDRPPLARSTPRPTTSTARRWWRWAASPSRSWA